jgi:hypothetical protein
MPYGALYGLAPASETAPLLRYLWNLEPRKLSIARQPNRHPQHPPGSPRAVSSLIGRGVSSLNCAYRFLSQSGHYKENSHLFRKNTARRSTGNFIVEEQP